MTYKLKWRTIISVNPAREGVEYTLWYTVFHVPVVDLCEILMCLMLLNVVNTVRARSCFGVWSWRTLCSSSWCRRSWPGRRLSRSLAISALRPNRLWDQVCIPYNATRRTEEAYWEVGSSLTKAALQKLVELRSPVQQTPPWQAPGGAPAP